MRKCSEMREGHRAKQVCDEAHQTLGGQGARLPLLPIHFLLARSGHVEGVGSGTCRLTSSVALSRGLRQGRRCGSEGGGRGRPARRLGSSLLGRLKGRAGSLWREGKKAQRDVARWKNGCE